MSLECVHTGTHTVIHHQYYQMVDLLMQFCRRTMGGLNPHALPHAPLTTSIDNEESAIDDEDRTNTKQKNDNKVESSKSKKGRNNNTASTKWKACRTKKGRMSKNNNKNKKEKNNKIFCNRFSRSQETTQDTKEVMGMLEKAVDDAKPTNVKKEEKEENKNISYDADTVDGNALETEIQKYVKSDKDDNNKKNKPSEKKENVDKDKNNDDKEDGQVHADCDLNQTESEYDSEKEREACYAMHPDSESELEDVDDISESDFEEWMLRKEEERWKRKFYSYSD